MKLTAPKFDLEEEATEALIDTTISALKSEPDSFAILGKDEMNYVQALKTEKGFVVQFQNGSLDEHYEFNTYLSRPQTIGLFKEYFFGNKNWQGNLEYSKVDLRGFAGRFGLMIGRLLGGFVRGFKDAKRKT